MSIDMIVPRSRRAMLAASLGGLAAVVGESMTRPTTVRAEGEAIVVGGEYTDAESVTKLVNTTNSAHVLWAESQSAGTGVMGRSQAWVGVYGVSASSHGAYGFSLSPTGAGIVGHAGQHGTGVLGLSNGSLSVPDLPASTGVYGYATRDSKSVGVAGESTAGTGVRGETQDGTGVAGLSDGGIGVLGHAQSGVGVSGSSSYDIGVDGWSAAADKAAIVGASAGNNTGVHGHSGAIAGASPAKTGVYGYAGQDAASRGVTGKSTAGYGVWGIATTGRGVSGQATSGQGVRGYATIGTAVYAQTPKASSDPDALYTGYALRAIGRVKLDQCAGVATIPAAAKSIAVRPGFDLTSASAVVATLQGSAGGTTTVHRVVVSTTSNTFTIHLTANSTQTVKVAWHVFG